MEAKEEHYDKPLGTPSELSELIGPAEQCVEQSMSRLNRAQKLADEATMYLDWLQRKRSKNSREWSQWIAQTLNAWWNRLKIPIPEEARSPSCPWSSVFEVDPTQVAVVMTLKYRTERPRTISESSTYPRLVEAELRAPAQKVREQLRLVLQHMSLAAERMQRILGATRLDVDNDTGIRIDFQDDSDLDVLMEPPAVSV